MVFEVFCRLTPPTDPLCRVWTDPRSSTKNLSSFENLSDPLYLSTFEVWTDGLTNWVTNGCKSLSCFSQLKIIPMQCCCFFPVQYSEGQNTIGFRRDGLILGSQPALCVILSYRTSMSSLSDMEDIKTNSGSLTRRKSRGWQGAIKKMLKSCWIQTLV